MSDLPAQPPQPTIPTPEAKPPVPGDKPKEPTTGSQQSGPSSMVPPVKNPFNSTNSAAQA